jgi:predicted O-methyltransferase YrrM
MTDESLGHWLKHFDDPVRRDRVWKIGLLTGLRFEKERGFFPPNFERGLVLDRLVEQRRPQRVLEIGTGRGLGSFVLAAAAEAYGVECQIETCDLIPPDKQQEWAIEVEGKREVSNTSCAEIWDRHLASLKPRVNTRTGRSTKTLPALLAEQQRFDLVFIDAGHDLFSVAHDLAYSSLLLAPGGAILMDDFAPLEPFGLGTCVAATHAHRFFKKVEIFPSEGLVFGGTDNPEVPRGMVLLSEFSGHARLHPLRLLWWRIAGVVLDLCYRAPLFPLGKTHGP